MEQRYRARWVDQEGKQREFLFESLDNLMIARVDFQLKLLARGIPRPDEYELEEVTHRFPSSIRLVHTGGSDERH